jgi:hypothetical protein
MVVYDFGRGLSYKEYKFSAMVDIAELSIKIKASSDWYSYLEFNG